MTTQAENAKIQAALDDTIDEIEAVKVLVQATVPSTPPPVIKGVDLVITSVAMVPAAPKVGDAVAFVVTVKNQGDTAIPTGSNFGTGIYLNGKVITWANHNTGLKAGETVILNTVSSLWPGGPWLAVAGQTVFTANVDDTNVLLEYNETNNTKDITLKVAVPVPPVDPPPVGGQFILFTPASPFRTKKVPGQTYAWWPNCDQRLKDLHYGINNGPGYYTPFYHSKPSDPMTHFKIGPGWNTQNPWTYDGPCPAGMVRPGGGDGNLDIAFPNGDLLDLYQAGGSGTDWYAAMGVLSNWKTGIGFSTPGPGPAAGTTAIGCVQAGGGLIADDIKAGEIAHALRIAFDYNDLGGAGGPGAWVGYAYGRNDDGGGPGPLAEGMFLMVDGPEPAGLPKWGHELWKCLSTYGCYITDRLWGAPLIFGDGSPEVADAFGYYFAMPWIDTVCKRLRATHFGF